MLSTSRRKERQTMARPSIKKQRTEEILKAFSRCIAKYSLGGSTLERLAEESGLQRSLIRHFVGNREDLIRLLADHVLAEFQQSTDNLFASLYGDNRIEQVIIILFDPQYQTSTENVLVLEGLIAAGANDFPEIKVQINQWLTGFIDRLAQELQSAFPNASAERCQSVSFGIISIYFNLDALSPLGITQRYRPHAIDSARALVASLHP